MKFLFVLFISILISPIVFAQEPTDKFSERKLVQFSGVVVDGEDLLQVPFTSIMVANTNRGTISDYSGYFSFVARENDTIIFSYIGYKPISFIIPDTLDNPRYSMIQMLNKDTFRLKEVEIYPWPSKEQFKEAFINLDVPDDDYYRAMQNLALAEMRDRRLGTPMGASMNQAYAIQQQQTMLYNAGQLYPTTNLLNPVAWAKFIESWRKGELKIKK
ncbi:MAG: carboxypeptidase-like regulatory domain-containing protein [Flavobacteriales bacterium]|nr:carboxypeptidase-like regulatory domain-containing protein [Flavobacteriales bacterium]